MSTVQTYMVTFTPNPPRTPIPEVNKTFGGIRRCPTGYLLNRSTGRYHPISFILDSDVANNTAYIPKWIPMGYHTKGFTTLEEARSHVSSKGSCLEIAACWLWDMGFPDLTPQFSTEIYNAAVKGEW